MTNNNCLFTPCHPCPFLVTLYLAPFPTGGRNRSCLERLGPVFLATPLPACNRPDFYPATGSYLHYLLRRERITFNGWRAALASCLHLSAVSGLLFFHVRLHLPHLFAAAATLACLHSCIQPVSFCHCLPSPYSFLLSFGQAERQSSCPHATPLPTATNTLRFAGYEGLRTRTTTTTWANVAVLTFI